jgi:hypothetical protein
MSIQQYPNVIYLIVKQPIPYSMCEDIPICAFYNEELAQKYVEDHGMDRYSYIEIDMEDSDIEEK